ncbi:MAG: ATP-binding cassette domain-containing protein [Fusobacteriaceae bacterium]|jgi:D-methionine transport system ATP-binding protein|nr:ATP-binding cassette domain-containing protein [Fusobacteriaceae bacterium]
MSELRTTKIKLKNIYKKFYTDSGDVEALNDVTLNIDSGEIFGVIGYSGAGKSTLVRCINLLERPSSGKIWIDSIELTALEEKKLRKQREKIGMIFQQFNLFASRTVYENVAFPLRYNNISKSEIDKRVTDLLDLVGISDKRDTYPSQLSGGQKQRVAIARALANNPSILLCDEATSALDPQTTKSILKLIKYLNKKLNLTVVIITHEMTVIKEICNKVAVMEDGKVVEAGPVEKVFAKPQAQITKDFINTTTNLSRIEELLEEKASIVTLNPNQKLLRLDFLGSNTKEAIITSLSRKFLVDVSIIFGNVEVIQGQVIGALIVILSGNSEKQNSFISELRVLNIGVEVLKDGK